MKRSEYLAQIIEAALPNNNGVLLHCESLEEAKKLRWALYRAKRKVPGGEALRITLMEGGSLMLSHIPKIKVEPI